MKKLSIFLIALALTLTSMAQVSQTVNVTTPGTLATLASAYSSTVTNLTVTGNIDARDVATMRDAMFSLAVLDLSGASIQGYTGVATTSTTTTYQANQLLYHLLKFLQFVQGATPHALLFHKWLDCPPIYLHGL